MDIFEEIRKRQKKFLETPRESIKKFLGEQEKFSQGLIKLSFDQNRPDMLLIYKEFHREYGELLGKLMENRLISGKSFKDDLRDGSIIQTNEEMKKAVIKYTNKSVSMSESIFSLKKSYSSILEILWGKLKRIIFLAGLNPQEKHLTLPRIKKKLEDLETQFSIDLTLTKSILEGNLRNCINHERAYFESPNFLVFAKEVNGKFQEFYRVNSERLIEELLKSFLILTTFHHIETIVMASTIKPLLKLDDEQLAEYCKTGVLTEEMQKKIEKIE